MPIFDFKCTNCGDKFEMEVITTSNLESRRKTIRCPHCKSPRVKKIISKPNIHFKGTGFYSTDKDK